MKPKPKRKVVKKGLADQLWRDIVRIKAGSKCEYCGKQSSLNSHHIFSRSRLNLRWDVDNGVCLCVTHHVFGNFSAHKSPIDFVEWLREKRGEEWYERLRKKSREIIKADNNYKLVIIEELKSKIERMSK